MENTYQYPNGPATVLAVAFAAVMAAETKNTETIITVGNMTAAGTLNLTASNIPVGGNLIVKASADATGRTLTFGTGFTAAPYAIGASKSVCIAFKFDGSKFVQTGAPAVLN